MKVIYTTDLHGSRAKYLQTFETAEENGAKAVVNGGDMLPKESNLHVTQREFVDGFLDDYLEQVYYQQI